MLDEQHTGCCTMPQSDYILGSTMKVPGPPPRGGGVGTWVNFCWVCAAGLSEPQPHYSLFFGQL